MIKTEGDWIDMLSLTKEEEKLIMDAFNAICKEPTCISIIVNGMNFGYVGILAAIARQVKAQMK